MKWLGRQCCTLSRVIEHDTQKKVIALVGNPNCGKSTVFNALTSGCERIGNWPGVTVEKKSGCFCVNQQQIELVDLPGVYSLRVGSLDAAVDERIAVEFVSKKAPDMILNIVDASLLERHLYLTSQLLEMGVPVIVGLNRMDVARARGVEIHIDKLSKQLGCPVIPLIATKEEGMNELKKAMVQSTQPSTLSIPYPAIIMQAKERVGLSLLENDRLVASQTSETVLTEVAHWQERIQQTLAEESDVLIADARYQWIQSLMKVCVTLQSKSTYSFTTLLDAVALNRIVGLPFFLLVMYALFFFALRVGGAFQDCFEIISRTFFVDGMTHLLQYGHAPDAVVAILANGVGQGLSTVTTFIPVIGGLFLGLAFLEDSGYMARAAFVVDRLMGVLGLPGKSFVPMIVGFGCNVPAVMASRTLDRPRDRILTVMMTPFMSCGARLAIYAVFTAAFFPLTGHNIVFGLYMMGIVMAVLTGWLLRKTVLQGEVEPLMMELPAYQLPTLRVLMRHTLQRLRGFVWRAGQLIVPICMVLGVLNSLTPEGTWIGEGQTSQSILSHVGRFLTPLFSPMGISEDNWPATVGLMMGVWAKEVVVGALNALYGQVAVVQGGFHLWSSLKMAVLSIPANLSGLSDAPMMSSSVKNEMINQFGSVASVMAYLLFVLLYFPCVSTVAAMWREIGWRWACFSVLWTTGLAYTVAVMFYQSITFIHHPWFSFYWIAGLVGLLSVLWLRLQTIRWESL